MDINIRKYVLQNLNNANFDVVRTTIEDAVTTEEEKVLPGLGVMFEVLWKRSTPDMKNTIINSIVEAVKS
ncbi:MAG TPA: small acid-soluble spore protein SspI [Bacilli bacterium]